MLVNSALSAVRRMGPGMGPVLRPVVQNFSNQATQNAAKNEVPPKWSVSDKITVGIVVALPSASIYYEHVVMGRPVDPVDMLIASLG